MNHYHIQIKKALVTACAMAAVMPAVAQQPTAKKDSVATGSDRGVLLNAASATEPRQVEIGLPMTYTAITFNGLPAVYYYWPNTTSNHWRSEQLLSKTSLLSMAKVAILQGELGYGVDSYAELGGEQFKGKAKYTLNSFGSHNFDVNLSGPMGKGWYYTVSAYNNFDPGSFDIKFAQYTDRSQFYTGGLTKKFADGGQLTLMYKYTDVHNLTSAANYAPFIWDGKGGVKEANGFKIGLDSYLPIDGQMTYLDVRTGEYKTTSLYDAFHTKTHEASAWYNRSLGNGFDLSLRAKFSTSDAGTGDQTANGIITAKNSEGARYADNGMAYEGDVQKRISQINKSTISDAFFIAEVKGKRNDHNWTFGFNEWFTAIDYARSTTTYYHTVDANPRKLIYGKNTSVYENFNGSTEYDKGTENKLALYLMDTWEPSNRFRLTYGARAEYYHANVDLLPFARFNGFYIGATTADGKVVKAENHTTNGLNYAISLAPKYNITHNFGLTGEANFIRQFRHLEAYSGTGEPFFKYRPYIVASAGIFYNTPWMELVSSMTYAQRDHDYGRIVVTNNEDLTQAPQMVNQQGGIKTLGWTTDMMLHPLKGFTMHARLTLQSPKYSGYSFSAFGKDYSFNNSLVTKQSKVIVELDPRYTIGKFAVWANFRYYSRQYVNVANTIYFNGRWETFGGMSYTLNKHITFTANVINFLGQTGAQGTIPSADTVQDASQFSGYMLTGNYIRPFQVELSTNIKF